MKNSHVPPRHVTTDERYPQQCSSEDKKMKQKIKDDGDTVAIRLEPWQEKTVNDKFIVHLFGSGALTLLIPVKLAFDLSTTGS